jgi:hypothetical protein
MKFLKLVIFGLFIRSSLGFFLLSQSAMPTTLQANNLPNPEESARALSDYMAKSHEDKLKAVAQCEKKYQAEIAELKDKIAQLEQNKLVAISSEDSFVFPVTNKAMTEKIAAYRNFITKYIVNAQEDKRRAVMETEKKVREHYEEKLRQKELDANAEGTEISSA